MTVSLPTHNSNYDGYSQWKQRLRRCVFGRLRRTNSDAAATDCSKHELRRREGLDRRQLTTAYGGQSATDGDEVERTWTTISLEVRRLAKFVGEVYDGAAPCWHL